MLTKTIFTVNIFCLSTILRLCLDSDVDIAMSGLAGVARDITDGAGVQIRTIRLYSNV